MSIHFFIFKCLIIYYIDKYTEKNFFFFEFHNFQLAIHASNIFIMLRNMLMVQGFCN